MKGIVALIPCSNDGYSLSISVPLLAQNVGEVVVVDDGSIDSTTAVCQWLAARFSNVRAVRNAKPVGWAEVRNQLSRPAGHFRSFAVHRRG